MKKQNCSRPVLGSAPTIRASVLHVLAHYRRTLGDFAMSQREIWDTETEEEIIAIWQLNRDMNTTFVIVTHEAEVAGADASCAYTATWNIG